MSLLRSEPNYHNQLGQNDPKNVKVQTLCTCLLCNYCCRESVCVCLSQLCHSVRVHHIHLVTHIALTCPPPSIYLWGTK